jgi:pimeloyl-ACP methyl ester carboxylesterase
MTDQIPHTGAEPRHLGRVDGHSIAYHMLAGKSPGVVFLGGLMSDMTGTKALALEDHCRAAGRAYLRFDYLGHGASSGDFTDGTIGRWTEDAVAVLDGVTQGPQVLVGSSLGGWLMLRVALARPERVAGLVGIAAAPDFTETMAADLDADEREALARDGVVERPSEYSEEPYRIARALIEDGRDHLVLNRPIDIGCPVRLLQGMRDDAVPWQTAPRIAAQLTGDDVVVTLVKDGDHRLSRPADLARLMRVVDKICALAG